MRLASAGLALEEVDGLVEVGGMDVTSERWILALQLEAHFPGDAAIAEMSRGRGTELGDVLSFGEVHFEESADASGEREQIIRGLRCFRGAAGGNLVRSLVRGIDGSAVVRQGAGFRENVDVV